MYINSGSCTVSYAVEKAWPASGTHLLLFGTQKQWLITPLWYCRASIVPDSGPIEEKNMLERNDIDISSLMYTPSIA